MERLDSIWVVVGTGVGIFVSVNILFFKADDFFSKKFKEDVSLRLLCLEPPDSKISWSDLFVQLFDRIFKKRPKSVGRGPSSWRLFVSWRTFVFSSIASILAVAIVFLIGITIGPLAQVVAELEENPNESTYLIYSVFPLTMNLIPDFLSLLESRYLLGLIRKRPSIGKTLTLLVFDLLATIIIFFGVGFFWRGCSLKL